MRLHYFFKIKTNNYSLEITSIYLCQPHVYGLLLKNPGSGGFDKKPSKMGLSQPYQKRATLLTCVSEHKKDDAVVSNTHAHLGK